MEFELLQKRIDDFIACVKQKEADMNVKLRISTRDDRSRTAQWWQRTTGFLQQAFTAQEV